MRHPLLLAVTCILLAAACAPKQPVDEPVVQNDSNTPLHLLQPDYKIPYGVPARDAVKADIERILAFVDTETPWQPGEDGVVPRGAFRLTSY